MLGFSYQGQAPLAALGQNNYVVKVSESVGLADRIKTLVHHLVRNVESFIASDTVEWQLVYLLRVNEVLGLAENIRTSFAFKLLVKEGIKVKETVKNGFFFIVREIFSIKEEAKTVMRVFVQELIRATDRVKINGRYLYYLWEACYHKGASAVERAIKKFTGTP